LNAFPGVGVTTFGNRPDYTRAAACAGGCPSFPTNPRRRRSVPWGRAVDYLRGVDTLAIVLELPAPMLTAGGTLTIGVWGTISR
jgi:hypothetical protein